MKKTTSYIIIIISLLLIAIGGTYAFFSASAGDRQINANSSKFEVIYLPGAPFADTLNLASNKDEGLNTTVNIKVATGSVDANVDLYINIEEISPIIANDALNWEVYKTINGSTSEVQKGTFASCEDQSSTKKQCQNGDKLYIVRDYKITEENTAFTVYIWLNGALVNNDVLGAGLKAYIGAKSENITANFE